MAKVTRDLFPVITIAGPANSPNSKGVGPAFQGGNYESK